MEEVNPFEKQIELAKNSRDVLAGFKGTRFTKWFHLRPVADSVTIVTTHPDRPMRGVSVSKTKLKEAIEFLDDCIATDGNTIDWKKIEAAGYNVGKGFERGRENAEFPYQAKMINGLQDNRQLIETLGAQNLYFTASEVVFRRGHDGGQEKIDIVAHDGAGRVFFFEMKAPENDNDKPVEQVNEYLKLYGKPGMRNRVFEDIISVYPQNPVTRFDEYIGYAVVGYGDDLISCKDTEYPGIKLLTFRV